MTDFRKKQMRKEVRRTRTTFSREKDYANRSIRFVGTGAGENGGASS